MRDEPQGAMRMKNNSTGIDRTQHAPSMRLESVYRAHAAATQAAASEAVAAGDGVLVEVPHEQYAECVQLLQSQSASSDVPEQSAPDDVERLIHQGSVEFLQARRLAEAGRVESLTWDPAAEAVRCSSPFGLSFVVAYARARWNGREPRRATQEAVGSGVAAGAAAVFLTGATREQLRVKMGTLKEFATRFTLKRATSQVWQHETHQLAAGAMRHSAHGLAAANQLPKLLRGNVLTGTVVAVAASAPDVYRAALERSISWRQLTKNVSVNAAGVATGGAGWLGGAAMGAALGSVVPVLGTAAGGLVGGILGAVGGGMGGSMAAKKVADRLVPDDCVVVLEQLRDAFQEHARQQMLTETETEQLASELRTSLGVGWFRMVIKNTSRGADATQMRSLIDAELAPRFTALADARERITLPTVEHVALEIQRLVEDAEAKSKDLQATDVT